MEQADKIQELINRGRFFEAAHEAKALVKENPMDMRMRQLAALAMSKSGTPKMAAEFLEPIYALNPDDPETAGILGGIYKSIFRKNQDPQYGKLSFETYLKNYNSTGSYYTGINAASMSTLIGLAGKGRKIAEELVDELDAGDFWQLATLAEAKLLLREKDEARDLYLRARQMAGSDWGKVGSIQSQLWLLKHMIQVPSSIMDMFNPPSIAAFVGHMIDHPSRTTPRFTPDMESAVKDAIRSMVRTQGINVAYCSLACGSDILFAEVMMEEEKELTLILPFNIEDFVKVSVAFPGGDWEERFRKIVENRPVITLTNTSYSGNDEYFSFLGKTIMGSAVIRAEMYNSRPELISVLSNYDLQNKIGGTRDMIKTWPFKENHQNINIDALRTAGSSAPVAQSKPEELLPDESISQISCIMICKINDHNALTELGLRSDLMDRRDEMIVAPQYFSLLDDIIIAVNSPNQLMELLDMIRGKLEEGYEYQLGLHMGPLYTGVSTEKELGPHFELTQKLADSAPVNTLLSTMNFAAPLAIENRNYQFDHTGYIDSPEGLEVEIFRIDKAG